MHASHDSPEEEAYEKFVCLEPNAISCPWTMMIHPHDAVLTNAAMVCSWRLEIITFLAPSPSEKAFVTLFQSNFVNTHNRRLHFISILVTK